MDYYYDVLLNFQERYCMFYEWDENDSLDYVKKIPLFHVNAKTFEDLRQKKVKVEKEFLIAIENKTKLKQNSYLKYTAIFSDGKNSLALEFDEEGYTLNKSSLTLEDELNINEFTYNVSLEKLDYKVIAKDEVIKETRQEAKVKKILRLEIDNMYQSKNYSKLKYIYLEWFSKLKSNPDEMYEEMQKKLEEKLTDKEYNIYELIKLSYNNV